MKKRERIYIFPTLYGFIYGGGSLLSLICAIVYANNLAYLLCFFLLALFVIGMHQSNSNLKGITVEKIEGQYFSAQAHGTATLWLKSHNSEGHTHLAIEGRGDLKNISGHIEQFPKKSLIATPLNFQTQNRGQKKMQRIKLSSRYPFGLFYVWRYLPTEYHCYVYPKPMGQQPLPQSQTSAHGDTKNKSGDGESFKGHRKYIAGESQKRVDWKALARGKPMMVKEYELGPQGEVHLPWVRHQPFEEQLQQISRWVMDCSAQRHPFSMAHPKVPLSTGRGRDHQNKALKILALAQESDR